jgi:hypothetical protein
MSTPRAATAETAGGVSRRRSLVTVLDIVFIDLVFLVVSLAFSGVQVAFTPFVADIYGYREAQAGLLLTYVLVYWAPFLLGAVLSAVVVAALLALVRRSDLFADD